MSSHNESSAPYSSPARLAQPTVPSPVATPGVALAEVLDWKSVVKSHKLSLEHAALDIDTDRVLYHMELEFTTPMPAGHGQPGQWICLTWPYGGLWKIERVTDNNSKVKCISWRKTEMQTHEIEELAKSANALAKKVEAGQTMPAPEVDLVTGDDVTVVDEAPDLFPTLFEWKMMRGEWDTDVTHWFIRDVEPPAHAEIPNLKRKLIATLFVGFDPLEASIEVNAVTSIDTVAQTYSADVTWQVMFPAITALREDAVLREFLDLLDINANHFEFTNITETQDQREITSSLVPAGDAQFRDFTLVDERAVLEDVYHLLFRRRVCATFTTEMALHSFPFDQQKLIFEFSTSSGMSDNAVHLTPSPVEPGSFSIENYQLGNVFDVLYHNKVFVSEIRESGPKKYICFEMVLQRRSGYYLTNVALIAAVITYLCFITYARQDDGTAMDMGSRLQVVTALVLTAVTFKNQVASLIPQVSYFTLLDSYVFVCFIVTTLVTIENALFPEFKSWVGEENWSDTGLLGISIAVFTAINVGWGLYVMWWLDRRAKAAEVLMQVHEYIREITAVVPVRYRSQVFTRFLETKNYEDWCKPHFLVTSIGDIHIQAPDDVAPENAAIRAKREAALTRKQQIARSESPQFKKIYFDMRPGLERRASAPLTGGQGSPALQRSPATRLVRTSDVADDAKSNVRRLGSALSYGTTAGVEPYRSHSNNTYFREGATAINVDPFRGRHISERKRKSGRMV